MGGAYSPSRQPLPVKHVGAVQTTTLISPCGKARNDEFAADGQIGMLRHHLAAAGRAANSSAAPIPYELNS